MSDTVTLEAHYPDTQGPTKAMQFDLKTYDREDIGDPLDNSRFLKECAQRDYDGTDVAELFEDVTPLEADRAMTEKVINYTPSVAEIGDEQVSLNRYHESPVADARLLMKFQDAGYSTAEIAETLGVREGAVRSQLSKHRMD